MEVSNFYWVKVKADPRQSWHMARKGALGWWLSYEFSCPFEGSYQYNKADDVFSEIIGPVKNPDEIAGIWARRNIEMGE